MIFQEGDISFDFDDACWDSPIQYDDKSNKDYHKVKNLVKGTKAVDFIGLYKKNRLVFIEVKDYRGFRIENKNKPSELAQSIGQKVRDTLSIILNSSRNSTNKQTYWTKLTKHFLSKTIAIDVVLWMEEDTAPNHVQKLKQKVQLQILRSNLKQKLNWLGSHIRINSKVNNDYSPCLSITLAPPTRT